ncbi:MAG: flagellar hook protein [Devosiaceae bacterium]|nr:flagellar hook protein [Devosiaceae bacterium MH13]
MSEINLSSSVRANLNSLQATADLMAMTQERLATGNEVNSALDDPTNFFTSESLNSRASDLDRLLDGVGNATQTLEAADNGISAITDLVESAQATARQAQQTSATIEETTGAAAAVIATSSTGDLSSLSVPAATSASIDGTAFTNIDLTPDPTTATAGTSTGQNAITAPVDLSGSNALTFSIDVDGASSPTAITVDAAAVSAFNTANSTALTDSALTAQQFVDVVNFQLDAANSGTGVGAQASLGGGGELVFTSDTTGTSSEVNITSIGGTAAAASGIGTPVEAAGTDPTARGGLDFTLTVDGNATNVNIDAAAVTAFNTANGTSLDAANLTAQNVADLINDQVGSTVATVESGALTFDSATTGTGSTLEISGFALDAASGAAGFTDTAQVAGAASAAGSITINGETVNIAEGDDSDAVLAAFQAAATASTGTNAFTVNRDTTTGEITITGTAGNDVAITGDAGTLAALGMAAGTEDGTPANAGVTNEVTNPERAEFIDQYNELIEQIDELAEDSGFNGVNLLNGDDLEVIFNEDGSSRLDIEGVDFSSTGLGLAALGNTAFDTNDSIDAVLDLLDAAISSLRTQASEFGSNLSIVETRENFTNDMINTLETGAANLTLADTNEESANLLALETRQSLSTTSLSMAVEADQNVLQLF